MHVLRVYVPESPYSTSQLQARLGHTSEASLVPVVACVTATGQKLSWLPSQDIFGLLLWVFRMLESASAPSFQRYVSILDTVSQVRSEAMSRLRQSGLLIGRQKGQVIRRLRLLQARRRAVVCLRWTLTAMTTRATCSACCWTWPSASCVSAGPGPL